MVVQWVYQDQMVFSATVILKIRKTIGQDVLHLLKTKNETILIDTSPDLRQQLINNKINQIDKVFIHTCMQIKRMELMI